VRIQLPREVPAGTTIPLTLKASWLICEEECIPGDATFTLDLVTGERAVPDPQYTSLFAAAQSQGATQTNWHTTWSDAGESIDVIVDDDGVLTNLSAIDAFPRAATLIAHSRGEVTRLPDGRLRIRTAKSDSFESSQGATGFLIADASHEPHHYFSVDAQPANTGVSAAAASTQSQSPAAPGVALALLLAFAGGVLLNLMPCVLPVLSLKALALAEHSHDRGRARRHGLLYLGGVLACFLLLASVLLALRAAGELLGWGFQLQSPFVVAVLATLMTVMGLSLSGVFDLGSRWMGVGQNLTEGSGARSAFFSGALAAVVASPCTAPFMGPALGFALTQSAAVALGVFAALALGLALPIVALSFLPVLGRWLPKPGPWMVRLKQILAYPLYATAIWLVWILGRQQGPDAMALALFGILAWVFGMWLWQSSGRIAGRTAAAVALLAGIAVLVSLHRAPAAGIAAQSLAKPAGDAQPWSTQTLAELREQGRPLLVNMTAAWCITCLANERVALSSSVVQESLRELDIAYLKGDWTHRDDAITTYLAQFGRSGVPLYVVYPRGGGEPEVLPQLLTPAIVDAALRRAAGPSESLPSP
ncbi:MAG TPA: thioredoxin family protein, partial [Povalibacter sp.]